jgi:hypothetical protein
MRNMMSDQSPFFEALVDGADPADLVQGDGVWRSNPDADRAADLWFFENLQQRTLPTGGQLEDPARDLF